MNDVLCLLTSRMQTEKATQLQIWSISYLRVKSDSEFRTQSPRVVLKPGENHHQKHGVDPDQGTRNICLTYFTVSIDELLL
jgi:hypothetical protein